MGCFVLLKRKGYEELQKQLDELLHFYSEARKELHIHRLNRQYWYDQWADTGDPEALSNYLERSRLATSTAQALKKLQHRIELTRKKILRRLLLMDLKGGVFIG